jgi:hypothetical protein
LNGSLFCAVVGGFLLFDLALSVYFLALIIALESGAVAIVLLLRLLTESAHEAHIPKTVESTEAAVPGFQHRLAGAALTYSLTGVAVILSRTVAAGVPGGAALLVLAQRAVGVVATLILQPMHAVVTPWLTQETHVALVRTTINRFLFAFTSLVASAALLFAIPWLPLTAKTEQVPTITALLLLAIGAANFTGIALRQWLLEGRRVVVAISFGIYVGSFAILALTDIRGPYAVAQTELISQYLQLLFVLRYSNLLGGATGHRPFAALFAAVALPLAAILVLFHAPPLVLFGVAAAFFAVSVKHAGSVVRLMQDLFPRRPW